MAYPDSIALVYTKSVPGGNSPRRCETLGVERTPMLGVLAENLIRPIGALFAVANGSGILPMGRGMD